MFELVRCIATAKALFDIYYHTLSEIATESDCSISVSTPFRSSSIVYRAVYIGTYLVDRASDEPLINSFGTANGCCRGIRDGGRSNM